jgi:flavin reductase (DIM6/NTAB) family NADH-FMN oxidoreductase RutF
VTHSRNDPAHPALMIDTSRIGGRERYQLLTSLVVPRPIGWLSTRSGAGVPNLAPFSYFAALSATPMLVGISIGSRGVIPKDSLLNIRDIGGFCVNIVTERQLTAMNDSAGEHGPEVDEFEVAGLPMAEAERVGAPYVENCPAVFECRLFKEVELGGTANTLVIGEVLAVRLHPELHFAPGTHLVDPEALRPVGRLGGEFYAPLGPVLRIPRSVVP